MKKHMFAVMLAIVASSANADWTENFEIGNPNPTPTRIKTAAPTAIPTPVATQIATPVPQVNVVMPAALPISMQTPDVSDVKADLASRLKTSGYVDVNVSMNTTTTDSPQNGAHLGTAQITLSSDHVKSRNGFLAQFIYGENALAFSSFNLGTSSPNVKQAYVYQTFGDLTVQAGKFIGFLGYELPDPNSNFNYTRSALFYAEPVYNMGVVAKYAINPVTNLIAYGVNENSSDISLDETKDFGASLQSLDTNSGFGLNWYRDNFRAVEFDHKDLLNAYGYYTVGNVVLAAEYLHSDTYFNAGAAYVNLVGDPFSVAFRGVYVSNAGVLPGDYSKQYTLTFKHKKGNVTNALDMVIDESPVSIYYNTANQTSQNNQTIVVLSSVYSF